MSLCKIGLVRYCWIKVWLANTMCTLFKSPGGIQCPWFLVTYVTAVSVITQVKSPFLMQALTTNKHKDARFRYMTNSKISILHIGILTLKYPWY
ncbi:hypothetical protein GDO81_003596 [Engystomops pustulosus]|uniref:Uncharacterized protein n=1 Tax=Engystomops pustulosus TaxID=76066 RepID=A0AAV7A0X2_ENGPU|nr:hypothetical protein GDO81_003596 [Engystomops pustulosus]